MYNLDKQKKSIKINKNQECYKCYNVYVYEKLTYNKMILLSLPN